MEPRKMVLMNLFAGQQWCNNTILEYLLEMVKYTILDQAEREIGNVYDEDGGGVCNLRITILRR